jgi:hypothetical protein
MKASNKIGALIAAVAVATLMSATPKASGVVVPTTKTLKVDLAHPLVWDGPYVEGQPVTLPQGVKLIRSLPDGTHITAAPGAYLVIDVYSVGKNITFGVEDVPYVEGR